MQRIIQITLGGRVIPIEEQAYALLDDYIQSLEMQFSGEEGKDDIIQDIENRIAELFLIKLQSGGDVIVRTDVVKVMDTLGYANQLHEEPANSTTKKTHAHHQYHTYTDNRRRLYRNPRNRMIGGVCSGLGNYFDIDPVIVRLLFLVLFLTGGIGVLAYILAWIIIPAARTPQEFQQLTGERPMDFDTIKRNMGQEMEDLKRKGEEMSRDLRDFFSKKKY